MYNLGDLAVQNLLLAVNEINVTVVFLKSSVRFTVAESAYEAGNSAGRRSVILIGILPLLPVFLSSWFQPTNPYETSAAKWFVPCLKAVERMEKFKHTHQLPVWLTVATVLVLAAILWWGLANWQHSSF